VERPATAAGALQAPVRQIHLPFGDDDPDEAATSCIASSRCRLGCATIAEHMANSRSAAAHTASNGASRSAGTVHSIPTYQQPHGFAANSEEPADAAVAEAVEETLSLRCASRTVPIACHRLRHRPAQPLRSLGFLAMRVTAAIWTQQADVGHSLQRD
jgi:hypothetical protein